MGGNLFARGLPADGSYRYVALMEDGMPVYDATELFFVNADIFVRVDENVERLEAVRGGNSALFGSNAPGGVVNFISKTGGDELSGSMQARIGTGGLARYGINVNGPVGDDWRFSVGGFYRFDDGVRDPGFPASRGGQIKANVTRRFDDGGHFRVYAKYLNDRNTFFLPLPLQNPDDPEFVPGFPSDGTMTSDEANFLAVPLPTGERLPIALEDGQRQEGGSIMAELVLDFADRWTFTNRARLMSVDHQWNALLPFEIVSAAEWAQGVLDQTPDGTDFELTYAQGGTPFNTANGLLSLGGLWHVDKPMSNFSNQLEVERLFDAGRLTLGTYFGHYEAGNTWYFNDVLTDVRNAPRMVDLRITGVTGNTVRQVTENGFRAYLPFYVNAEGEVSLVSLYGGLEWELTDRLRGDLGVRWEHDRFDQNNETTGTFDLGGPSEADDAVNFGTRNRDQIEWDFDEWAASVGLNYLLSDELSVYGRASRGYKMPLLDQYLFATDPDAEGFPSVAETLWQVEGGVKASTPWLGLSAVAYWLQLSDFPSQDAVVVDGQTTFVTRFVGEARTIGLEVEAVTEPAEGLRVDGTLTLQSPEYESFVSGEQDFSGNQVRRIPSCS